MSPGDLADMVDFCHLRSRYRSRNDNRTFYRILEVLWISHFTLSQKMMLSGDFDDLDDFYHINARFRTENDT